MHYQVVDYLDQSAAGFLGKVGVSLRKLIWVATQKQTINVDMWDAIEIWLEIKNAKAAVLIAPVAHAP